MIMFSENKVNYILHLCDDSETTPKQWIEKQDPLLRVISTSSPFEFLALLRTGPYICALIDRKIHVDGGYQFVNLVQETSRIPLIMLSENEEDTNIATTKKESHAHVESLDHTKSLIEKIRKLTK